MQTARLPQCFEFVKHRAAQIMLPIFTNHDGEMLKYDNLYFSG